MVIISTTVLLTLCSLTSSFPVRKLLQKRGFGSITSGASNSIASGDISKALSRAGGPNAFSQDSRVISNIFPHSHIRITAPSPEGGSIPGEITLPSSKGKPHGSDSDDISVLSDDSNLDPNENFEWENIDSQFKEDSSVGTSQYRLDANSLTDLGSTSEDSLKLFGKNPLHGHEWLDEILKGAKDLTDDIYSNIPSGPLGTELPPPAKRPKY